MSEPAQTESARALRTRAAIVDAFTALAFKHRYDRIRVADLITKAGVGRSTFYEHFRSKGDVVLEAMQPVLLVLATAASGRAARSYVRAMVCHLWDRRSTGRSILDSITAPVIQRRLATSIRTHVVRQEDSSAVAAIGVAAAQLAMLRCWLAGQATASIDEMTDRLIACSRLYDGMDR